MNSSNSMARLAAVSRSRPYMRPAKLRNSAPVRRPNRAMPSGTTPIWRFTSTGLLSRSRPRISMRPELGASNPVSILMVVDLPAPLGPRKPKNCPGATRRLTPSTATSSPKRRVRDWVEMLGARSIEASNLAHDGRRASGFGRRGSHTGVLAVESCCVAQRPPGTLFLLRLLLPCIFGPWRNNADETGVGDRLSEMLGGVADDKQQGAAFRILATEPVHALVEVCIRHRFDGLLGVRKRLLESR